jgi:DNA-binding CsgD family transcriptional regulator
MKVKVNSKHGANKLSLQERRKKIFDLKKMGMNYGQIAAVMGMSRSGVEKAVRATYRQLQAELIEDVKDVLALDLARLDAMLAALWRDTIMTEAGEDPGAYAQRKARNIEIMLKILERRANYLGLDAPKKTVSVEAGIDLTQLDNDQLQQELEKMGMVNPSQVPPIPIDFQLPGETIDVVAPEPAALPAPSQASENPQ